MELETDGSLSKEDTDSLASALTDIAIAAGEGCTTWGDVAAVLNDVEHAVEKLRVVITALIAAKQQHVNRSVTTRNSARASDSQIESRGDSSRGYFVIRFRQEVIRDAQAASDSDR
jgi:hypothetical protein